jgi:hypothetical protein
MAAESLLVKCTVPVYPVAVLLIASRAVTVMPNDDPVVTWNGADMVRWVAGPGT